MSKSSLAHISHEEPFCLYNEHHLTTQEIGKLFGVSDDVVRFRLIQLGIVRRNKSEAAKGPRPGARRLCLSRDELERLYVLEGLDTSEIGRMFGVCGDTVRRHLKEYRIARRDKSAAAIDYPRNDFSGDPLEKAYLIGFRLGDLWVKPTNEGATASSITVTCTTTRVEQINLFQELFIPYGHVTLTPSRDGNYVVSCHLNRSFDFMLPKKDCIPDWITDSSDLFVAFLAGYTDAEGCFNVPADRQAIFRLQSYDVTILHQIYALLNNSFGIMCPPPRLAIPKGYRRSNGFSSNNDCWGLTVKRKQSLLRLCMLLEPHLRHSKRREDMEAVRRNVIERGVKRDE